MARSVEDFGSNSSDFDRVLVLQDFDPERAEGSLSHINITAVLLLQLQMPSDIICMIVSQEDTL